MVSLIRFAISNVMLRWYNGYFHSIQFIHLDSSTWSIDRYFKKSLIRRSNSMQHNSRQVTREWESRGLLSFLSTCSTIKGKICDRFIKSFTCYQRASDEWSHHPVKVYKTFILYISCGGENRKNPSVSPREIWFCIEHRIRALLPFAC